MSTRYHCRISFVWLGVLVAILASSAKTGRVFSQTKTDASGATGVSPVLQQEHGQDARGTHQTQAAGTPRPEPPRISLQEFRIEPTSLSLGEPFVIHARAAATGIDLGSFLLRTADEVRKQDTIEGFPLYSNGKYYVAERGKYFLMDNYSRAYTCESTDDGLTWRFLSNIAYEEIGSEGYNEGSLRRLPNGELLAVLRTGNEKDLHCQDNPIMWTVSRDDGRTWTQPERTGVEGAYPSLAVLSDGLVVMSYGRPGAMLVFSADGGRAWTDANVVDTTPYSGYTDVVEVGAGHLLVGFGTREYLDPATGSRSDQLRLAHVRYEDVRKRPRKKPASLSENGA